MNRKFFFIIIVLIISFLFAGCSLKKPTKLTTTTTTKRPIQTTAVLTTAITTTVPAESTAELLTVDPTNFDNSLSANFNLASTKAREWNKDAVFYGMIVETAKSLKKNSAKEIYVFGSPKDKNNWWVYTYDEATKKSMRAVVPKEDLSFNKNAVPAKVQYWKTNFIKALQAANADQSIPGQTEQVVLTLANSEPKGWLWWNVQYLDQNGKIINKTLVEPASGDIADAGGEVKTAVTTTRVGVISTTTTVPDYYSGDIFSGATTTMINPSGSASGSASSDEYGAESSADSSAYSGSSYYNLTTAPGVPTGGVTKNTLQAIKDSAQKNWIVISVAAVALIIIGYLIYLSVRRRREEDEGDLDIPF